MHIGFSSWQWQSSVYSPRKDYRPHDNVYPWIIKPGSSEPSIWATAPALAPMIRTFVQSPLAKAKLIASVVIFGCKLLTPLWESISFNRSQFVLCRCLLSNDWLCYLICSWTSNYPSRLRVIYNWSAVFYTNYSELCAPYSRRFLSK